MTSRLPLGRIDHAVCGVLMTPAGICHRSLAPVVASTRATDCRFSLFICVK